MTKRSVTMLGIDLGKSSCSLVGLDAAGAVVLRRRARRETIIHAGYVCADLSSPPSSITLQTGRAIRFFEQAVLEREVSHDLLERAGFAAELFHFIRGRSPGGVAG